VGFPDYCGPHWIQDKPKWVPIPSVNIPCSNHCCTVNFIPLSLAYATTGHTFQGQSAGPEHTIPCIIVQPGTLNMECLCPSLFYMFISRGTMIGTPEDRSSSAIFFTTDELTRDRIQNLTKNQKGELCKKVKRESQWVKVLQRNKMKTFITRKIWCKTTKMKEETTRSKIEDTSWRKCNSINY
jgi:hypothetical protein